MVSFSDLTNGPKVFEDTFGSKWGPRYWRAFFVIVVLAIVAVALSEIGGVGKSIISNVGPLFLSRTNTIAPDPPSQAPVPVTTPAPALPTAPPIPPPETLPRVYTTRTIKDLIGQCENRTQIQCSVLMSYEAGKWIRVEGVIGQISPNGVMIFKTDPERLYVACLVGAKWRPKLGVLNINDTVSVEGLISGIINNGVAGALSLDECELL